MYVPTRNRSLISRIRFWNKSKLSVHQLFVDRFDKRDLVFNRFYLCCAYIYTPCRRSTPLLGIQIEMSCSLQHPILNFFWIDTSIHLHKIKKLKKQMAKHQSSKYYRCKQIYYIYMIPFIRTVRKHCIPNMQIICKSNTPPPKKKDVNC